MAEQALRDVPTDPDEARGPLESGPCRGGGASGPGAAACRALRRNDEESRDVAKKNFLALVFCLMVGTAGLPHLLARFYTTPSVKRGAALVFWSLLFISLLYFTAPALAILVKYEVYNNVVGTAFMQLPAWVSNWAAVDKTLMSITDLNRDGIVQLAEVTIGGDMIVLATPEIAGLPYVITGLVAAGGLAAALSTADGLLLTIANALSHDVYYKMIDPNAATTRRLVISKALLLVVALTAAWVTLLKPGNILFLVGAAFSLAAACLLSLVGAWHFLEARQSPRRRAWHDGRAGHHHLLHGDDLRLLRHQCAAMVGHQAHRGGNLRHTGGLHRRDRRLAVSPAPSHEIQAMVDRVRYPEPGRRSGYQRDLTRRRRKRAGDFASPSCHPLRRGERLLLDRPVAQLLHQRRLPLSRHQKGRWG